MTKQVFVPMSMPEQGHNGGQSTGNFSGGNQGQNNRNNQRQNNQQQSGGNNNQQNNQRQNNDQNQGNNQRQNNNQNNVQRHHKTTRIYQRVTVFRYGNYTYTVAGDGDFVYEDGVIVDTRIPRSNLIPAGFVYAMEGKLMLVDKDESPDLYAEIWNGLQVLINEFAEAEAAIKELRKSGSKRPSRAKNEPSEADEEPQRPTLNKMWILTLAIPALIAILYILSNKP